MLKLIKTKKKNSQFFNVQSKYSSVHIVNKNYCKLKYGQFEKVQTS